jgi:DNA-binding GntR family transcriptional regulator
MLIEARSDGYDRIVEAEDRPAPPRRINPAKRLAAAVYEDVKARILSGEFAPGERLSVDELCRDFEVSRQPVMEAMRRLSAEWLVDVIPQVGCRVANYPRQAIVDFVNTFGEMEGLVAALAAQRRTDEQIARLEAIMERIRRSESWNEENRIAARDYHLLLLEMADSEVMARLCAQMWDFGHFVVQAELVPAQAEAEIVEHQRDTLERLSAAIAQGSASLARLHMTVWLTSVTGRVTLDGQPQPGFTS